MKLLTFLSAAASAATETTGAAAETTTALTFDPMQFAINLEYMGIGMLVIFVIIGVIILATALINKIFSKKAD